MNKVFKYLIPVLTIVWCFFVIFDSLSGSIFNLGRIYDEWAAMTVVTSLMFIILFFNRMLNNQNLRLMLFWVLGIFAFIVLILGLLTEERDVISSIGTSMIFILLSIHGLLFEKRAFHYLRISITVIVYTVSNLILILYFLDPQKIYSLPGLESVSWNTAVGFLLYSSTLLSGYHDELTQTKSLPDGFEVLNKKFMNFWFLTSFSFPLFIIIGISLLYFIDGLSTKAGMAIALFGVGLFPFPMTYLIYKEMIDWSSLLYSKNKQLFNREQDIKYHNELLNEFAQITSHNLRGPAIGLSNITEMAFDEETPDEIKKQSFELLQEKLPSLVSTIDNLARFYNMIKQGEIIYEICSIENLVHEAISISKNNYSAEPVDLVLSLDFEVSEVEYPVLYLENIFQNLISNSFKYRKPDQVLRISVTTNDLGEEGVQICYRDNGLGMNLEYFENKIFKFGRSYHNFENSKGIGLFIVKNQLNRLGDLIEVKSEEGEYTEFIIKLNHHGKKDLGYR